MKRLLVFTVACFLCGVAVAGAQDEIGELRDIRGDVQVLQSGEAEWYPAVENMPVQVKDRLKTGSNASCDLVFDDGTLLEIGANSETEVSSHESTAQTYARSVFLWLGKVLAHVEKANGRTARFEVCTPVSVCAVRGTEFAVETGGESATVGVFDGEVDVIETGGAPGTATRLAPEQEAVVIKGQPPMLPRALSAAMQHHRSRMQFVRQRSLNYRQQWRTMSPEQRRSLRQKALHHRNELRAKHIKEDLKPGRKRAPTRRKRNLQ